MAGFYGQQYKTLGMEYETAEIDVDTMMKTLPHRLEKMIGDSHRNVNITRDASIESKAEPLMFGRKIYMVSTHTKAYRLLPGVGRNGTKTLGTELFLSPLEIPDFARIVHPTFSILRFMGDYTSHRASTHFHVGFPNNLEALKSMLQVALNLEPVFYRLGGMGGTHRGYINKYNYCRPLLNSAVVVVNPTSKRSNGSSEYPPQRVPKTYAELIEQRTRAREEVERLSKYGESIFCKIANPIAALSVSTIEEFWACFGMDYVQQISAKYHPVRYMGWNFFSVAKHKTMEARHFNQSLDAHLVVATGKFVRASIEMAGNLSSREREIFEILSPFEEIHISDAVTTIEKVMGICQSKGIEDLPSNSELRIIYETLEDSHVKPLPQENIRTHVDFTQSGFVLDPYIMKLGKLERVENPESPCHVDIHNISEKEQSIYDLED